MLSLSRLTDWRGSRSRRTEEDGCRWRMPNRNTGKESGKSCTQWWLTRPDNGVRVSAGFMGVHNERLHLKIMEVIMETCFMLNQNKKKKLYHCVKWLRLFCWRVFISTTTTSYPLCEFDSGLWINMERCSYIFWKFKCEHILTGPDSTAFKDKHSQ